VGVSLLKHTVYKVLWKIISLIKSTKFRLGTHNIHRNLTNRNPANALKHMSDSVLHPCRTIAMMSHGTPQLDCLSVSHRRVTAEADAIAVAQPQASLCLQECLQFSPADNWWLISRDRRIQIVLRPQLRSHTRFCPEQSLWSQWSLSESLCYNEDIQREIKNTFIRTNMLIRKFNNCSRHVKCTLFKSYCLSLYDIALWRKYTVKCFNKLRSVIINVLNPSLVLVEDSV